MPQAVAPGQELKNDELLNLEVIIMAVGMAVGL
jgi:hypothetical protein